MASNSSSSCLGKSLESTADHNICILAHTQQISSKVTMRKPRSQERRIDKIDFLEVADICAIIITHASA